MRAAYKLFVRSSPIPDKRIHASPAKSALGSSKNDVTLLGGKLSRRKTNMDGRQMLVGVAYRNVHFLQIFMTNNQSTP